MWYDVTWSPDHTEVCSRGLYSQIKDYLLKELKGKFSKIQGQHHTTLSVDNKSKIGYASSVLWL
jgi:hypothetical protein